jgi:putative oxidoreductase
MAARSAILAPWTPQLLSVLRIVAALLYLVHGTQKVFNFPPNPQGGAFGVFTLLGFAGLIEIVAGVMLLLGIFTRPVAFVSSGQMAAAYFITHASRNFWPILNAGELAIVLCFTFLYFAAAGPGPWSLDAVRTRGKGRTSVPPHTAQLKTFPRNRR